MKEVSQDFFDRNSERMRETLESESSLTIIEDDGIFIMENGEQKVLIPELPKTEDNKYVLSQGEKLGTVSFLKYDLNDPESLVLDKAILHCHFHARMFDEIEFRVFDEDIRIVGGNMVGTEDDETILNFIPGKTAVCNAPGENYNKLCNSIYISGGRWEQNKVPIFGGHKILLMKTTRTCAAFKEETVKIEREERMPITFVQNGYPQGISEWIKFREMMNMANKYNFLNAKTNPFVANTFRVGLGCGSTVADLYYFGKVSSVAKGVSRTSIYLRRASFMSNLNTCLIGITDTYNSTIGDENLVGAINVIPDSVSFITGIDKKTTRKIQSATDLANLLTKQKPYSGLSFSNKSSSLEIGLRIRDVYPAYDATLTGLNEFGPDKLPEPEEYTIEISEENK